MKILIAALLMIAASSARAHVAGDKITSVCRFSSTEGEGEASFTVTYVEVPDSRGGLATEVSSSLRIVGRQIPSVKPVCEGGRNRSPRCYHADAGGSYTVLPGLLPSDKADTLRIVRWLGGEQVQVVAETADCQ